MKTLVLAVLVILLVLVLLISHTHGIKIAIEKRLSPFINRIYLHCQSDSSDDLTTPVQFYRSVLSSNGLTVEELFASQDAAVIMFIITPENEGVYSCVDTTNNRTSSNNISLVGESC